MLVMTLPPSSPNRTQYRTVYQDQQEERTHTLAACCPGWSSRSGVSLALIDCLLSRQAEWMMKRVLLFCIAWSVFFSLFCSHVRCCCLWSFICFVLFFSTSMIFIYLLIVYFFPFFIHISTLLHIRLFFIICYFMSTGLRNAHLLLYIVSRA